MEQLGERPGVAARIKSARKREDDLIGRQFAKDHEDDARKQAELSKPDEKETAPDSQSSGSLPEQEKRKGKRKAEGESDEREPVQTDGSAASSSSILQVKMLRRSRS